MMQCLGILTFWLSGVSVGIGISHGASGKSALMALDLLVALGWLAVCVVAAACHQEQVLVDEAREKIRASVRREP